MTSEDPPCGPLVFYTRRRCHLCDVAKAELLPLLEEFDLELEERDVDDREEWARSYGDEVPVGVLEGRRLFKFRVDLDRLRRALRGRLGEGS